MHRVVVIVVLALWAVLLPGATQASEPSPSPEPVPQEAEPGQPPEQQPTTPAPTSIEVDAPTTVVVDVPFTVTARLTGPDGPLAGRSLLVDGPSHPARSVTTDAAGELAVPMRQARAGAVTVTVAFAGDADLAASEVSIRRTAAMQRTTLALTAPASVRDGRPLVFSVTGSTSAGRPATGRVTFVITEKARKKPRRVGATLVRGKASGRVRVYGSATVVASVPASSTATAATSRVRSIRYLPSGSPVRLPGPKPRIRLKAQPLATSAGADVRVSRIPNAIWKDMQGKSWRRGCTPRSRLRLIRVNYYAFDGYRRQGELVVAANAVPTFRNALNRLYGKKIPIRAMYRVDRFGYNATLRGADDYRSMAADNTSAFNCRGVVGNPSRRSPHSTGRSFDINPWENPFRSSHGWTPNTYWVGRSHPRVAWRTHRHVVVRTLKAAGFRWTYGANDAHHFDA